MIELVNSDRTRAGLAPLRTDLELSAVARAHSQDMANRDYSAHVNQDGQRPFDRMHAVGVDTGPLPITSPAQEAWRQPTSCS
jgi:uncharacterized protein YkwD